MTSTVDYLIDISPSYRMTSTVDYLIDISPFYRMTSTVDYLIKDMPCLRVSFIGCLRPKSNLIGLMTS